MQGRVSTEGNIIFHCNKICNLAWPDEASTPPMAVKMENPEANARTLIKIKGPVLPTNQPIETALPPFVRQVKNLMKTTGARQIVLQTPLWSQDRPVYKSRDSQQTSGRTENDPLMLTFTFLI